MDNFEIDYYYDLLCDICLNSDGAEEFSNVEDVTVIGNFEDVVYISLN